MKLFEIKFNSMASFYDNYDYYKKMLQLQERLRKSEEERIRLEERFKTLMQESRNRHYTCISRLRLRYIEFLEEQRTKNDKNQKLLDTLNNVDNSLVLMTAKINRLNLLKEQYENYQRQINAIHSLPESTISGIDKVKEIENRNSKKNITVKHLSPEMECRSSPQMVWLDYQINPSISSSTSNLTNETRSVPKYTTQFKPFNQQINDNQNTFQIHQVPEQNDIQSVPLHNLSLQHLQYKLPYRQTDSDLYVSQSLSNLPLNSLSRQNITYLPKSPKRMETIQMKPRCITRDTSQDTLLDVSQNQSKLRVTQSYINPTVAMHSFRPENRRISLKNNYTPTPIIIRRNVPSISLSSTTSNLPKRHYRNYLNYPLRNVDRLQKSVSDIPMHSLMTSTDERFNSKDLDNRRISQESKTAPVQDSESRMAITVENELDKYIANIDKLHREHNMQNLRKMNDEENKNTSSDNEQQNYTENQSNENLSKDIKEVLALAGDLASKTSDLNDATDIPVSEKSQVVSEGHETSVVVGKDKISNDTTLYDPKLDSHEDTEKSEKQLPKLQDDQNTDSTISSNDKFMEQNDNKNLIEENLHHEKPSKEHGVFVSKESQLNHCSFEIAEELEPWNLDSVQKQIKEEKLTKETDEEFGENKIISNVSELNEDQMKEVEEVNKVNITENQDFEENINTEGTNNQLSLQNNDDVELKEDIEDNYETEISKVSNLSNLDQKLEEQQYYTNNENVTENPEPEHYSFDEQKEMNNVQIEECYETNQGDTQEYNDQNCIEESNQVQNEEYNYNPNTSYEHDQNLNYDQNVPSHDSQQQEHQEYVQESNEHDFENQYKHDYNVQSQENLDQQNVDYQQSDPNPATETNVNQSYEYTDFNQPEIMQENEEQESKYDKPQQEVEEISEKTNMSQNKSTKVLTGNESNSKKNVIKSLLDSDTDSTIERNVSNTESDFDFN